MATYGYSSGNDLKPDEGLTMKLKRSREFAIHFESPAIDAHHPTRRALVLGEKEENLKFVVECRSSTTHPYSNKQSMGDFVGTVARSPCESQENPCGLL